MSGYVNLDEIVTAEFYDEEHEERFVKEATVEEILSICDSYTVVDPFSCNGCKYESRWNRACNLCARNFIDKYRSK